MTKITIYVYVEENNLDSRRTLALDMRVNFSVVMMT